MTGTPIQNHLDEMWALFDFVCKGKVLGTRYYVPCLLVIIAEYFFVRATFKVEFAERIIAGSHKNSSDHDKQVHTILVIDNNYVWHGTHADGTQSRRKFAGTHQTVLTTPGKGVQQWNCNNRMFCR
jgi:hypothetical protein